MEKSSAFEIIPADYSPAKIDNSIATLNQPLANMLVRMGLPTENMFFHQLKKEEKSYSH
ncbi:MULTISPECIES: hypothetical protein [Bacillus]|uniref:Uncharacterized protein n=1 Tax=Bacillus velezensis TaxID=492670 RepID=A0A7D7G981_BACVE|nr:MULTISPECIES: hypothetical protein [Bacillus]ASB67824.1 hypothetical protein S101413_04408 [Bacillus velezensis]MCM8510044.1 hypothetical protein [Bacillus amyloliquefaciens]MCT6680783.1 hypothetical protein [Bacillus velezensis]MCU9590556.1 hypothetical protein [Bacillus velezensis]MEC0379559.1 hypothetical protein [Bacillus velezensis]